MVRIVAYYKHLVVAGIHARLEDLHLLLGEFGTAQSTDQFLGLAAEHASADHFDPALALGPVGGALQEHVFGKAALVAAEPRMLQRGEK